MHSRRNRNDSSTRLAQNGNIKNHQATANLVIKFSSKHIDTNDTAQSRAQGQNLNVLHDRRHRRNTKCSQYSSFLSRRLVLAILSSILMILIDCQPAKSVTPDQLPAFMSQPSHHSGPSLCPLVTACQCKWSNGKQGASCERHNLAIIPNNLPPDTQVLSMNGNNLVRLGPNLFHDRRLTNLQKIYLSDCKISLLSDETFTHLSNLIELDLSHNSLQQIPVKSFEQLKHSLRKLILAYNQLQVIEADSFSTLSQLNVLDLSYNLLTQIKPDAFHGLAQLKELKLNDNRLTYLAPNAIVEPSNYLNIDLYGNPWHCDCELRPTVDWMMQHNIQQSIIPTCATPQRHKDIRWFNVRPEEFICPPVVINRQNELVVVGVGSNVSFPCSARGSPAMTFVWLQDEKNLTTPRTNMSDPPASTKVLEEKRYEIAEETVLSGNPTVVTSILYLFNLKLTDTSLFLCWIDNPGGFTIANFSLVVTNDLPPSPLPANNEQSTWSYVWQSVGLNRGEAQLGIVSIGFIIFLALAILLLIIFKNVIMADCSSKDSESGDSVTKKPARSNGNSGLSTGADGKHGKGTGNSSRSTLTESEESDTDDHQSSGSGSSCRKVNSKTMAGGDLDGFIEHMRTGIINMDYHSMSPVIQFNNTLKKNSTNNGHNSNNSGLTLNKQSPTNYFDPTATNNLNGQPMHHFASASNTSSIPYHGPGGTGTASMTTTTSDLSPGSGTGYQHQTNFINGAPMTNCDLAHQMTDFQAPATNTTTTSYTSDYQSGYSEEPNMMPPRYYNPVEPSLSIPATMYNPGPIMMSHAPHPAANGTLVVQDRAQNRMMPANQRSRYDSRFQIL